MEIRVLQYFMAVARHENITKAAEELHLTQPTLSRQLSDLEEELGVQLLVRGKRKTQLTEAGLIFKARAQEILSLTEKTKEQFAKMDELVAGDIYIGAGETQAMAYVAKVLAPLRRSYPRIQFHLVSGNEDLIYDSLQKGLLDFGLVCRADAPRTYVFRRIPHDDAWGLMMRADNPLAAKEAVQRDDLFPSRAGSLFRQRSGENRGGRHLQLALQYNLLHRGGHGQCALLQGHGGCRRFVTRARLPSLGPRDSLGELCGLAQRPGLLPRRSSRRGGPGRGVLSSCLKCIIGY